MTSSSSLPAWVVPVSLAVNVCLLTYLLYRSELFSGGSSSTEQQPSREKKRRQSEQKQATRDRAESISDYTNRDLVPPLPEVVRDLLSKARLCYLATSDTASPHLSLMNFTHSAHLGSNEGDCVIMSTRRDTKKYKLLIGNSNGEPFRCAWLDEY